MQRKMKEYVYLLDKSLSMYGKEDDILDVLNQQICKLEKCLECSYVTLGLFSEQLDVLYIHNEWKCVRPLNRQTYFVEGGTALYDAVCEVCHRIEQNLTYVKEDIEKCVEMIVITDGIDNASVYHDEKSFAEQISMRIKDGWKIQLMTPANTIISWDRVCKNM